MKHCAVGYSSLRQCDSEFAEECAISISLKVQVWIYRKAQSSQHCAFEVLLLRLKPDRGGYWQPVTGGVDEGESLVDAAFREATEETGLTFEGCPETLNYYFRFRSPRYSGECEEHVFALEASSASGQMHKVRLDPHEHVDCQWVALSDAEPFLRHPSNVEGLRRLSALRVFAGF